MISLSSLKLTKENSTHDGAPRQTRYSHLLDTRHHFPLLLLVRSTVEVLHADELRPAVGFGNRLVLHELPSEHAARADIYGAVDQWLSSPYH
jgi:hypothetical protein